MVVNASINDLCNYDKQKLKTGVVKIMLLHEKNKFHNLTTKKNETFITIAY